MIFGKINRLSFDHYLNKLQNKEVFSFSRWGDGEWLEEFLLTHNLK